ncbi:MAG: Holliday junction branch migration protein RuvA [Anaerolineae bacterium]|nr:Holliday junction branch migration protein RuvA [Anaerolineae bacterium]
MISQLTGKIAAVEDGFVVLDVGGVGFGVFVPMNMVVRAGEQAILYTSLQVRETELTLYGFAEPDDKALFELLLSVSGVGPKAALSLMSTLASETLRRAIVNGQPEVLARAPGVGRKTGEAIVLHLKDKISRYAGVTVQVSEDDADVIAALTALGFSIVEAQRALQQLPREGSMTLDEKIRQALTYLGQ